MKISLKYAIGKALLTLPILRYKQIVYELLGVKKSSPSAHFFIGNPFVIGEYSNIIMADNAEIERGSFLVARDKIEIGENSTMAYGVTILTHADSNGPYNRLSKLYPPKQAPVVIGKDCWIGANVTILPGVSIGNCSVVAAGSVVTKDVPPGVMVAGCPAVIKKHLNL